MVSRFIPTFGASAGILDSINELLMSRIQFNMEPANDRASRNFTSSWGPEDPRTAGLELDL